MPKDKISNFLDIKELSHFSNLAAHQKSNSIDDRLQKISYNKRRKIQENIGNRATGKSHTHHRESSLKNDPTSKSQNTYQVLNDYLRSLQQVNNAHAEPVAALTPTPSQLNKKLQSQDSRTS